MNHLKRLTLQYFSTDYIDYIKNISTLVFGSLLAQIIAFVSIPILSRIYVPSEFGIYSSFITIAGMLGLISNLLYDRAIILSSKKVNALNIFVGCIFLALLTTFAAFSLIYFLKIFNIFGYVSNIILFLIPLKMIQLGFYQPIEQISIRSQYYLSTAIIKSSNSFLTSLLQILSKFFLNLSGGLIFGKLISDIISTTGFLILNRNFFKNFKDSITLKKIFKNFKKHAAFPKYQLPSVFANTVSQGMPIVFLGYFFSLEIAGFYGMSIRLLKQPTELIGSSTQNVFYQKASSLFKEGKSIVNIFKQTTLGLIKIYLLPLVIISLFAPKLFSFLLGDQWVESGILAQSLIFWCFFSFIKPPSNVLFNILNLQKYQLKIEIVQFILRAIVLLAGYYLYNSYLISISLYVLSSVIIDIFTMIFLYNALVKYEKTKNTVPKVMFFISGLGQGGAERVLTKIANECIKNKMDVSIVSGYDNSSAYKIDESIKVYKLGYKRLKSSNIFKIIFPVLKRIYCLRNIMNKINPDVIVSFGDATNVQSIVANKFLRINSSKNIISIRTNPKKLNMLTALAIRIFYNFSNLLIVQTSFVQNWAKKRFKKLKIKTIYNPIDLHPINDSSNEINFLNVGTIKFEKNQLFLLKAFNQIKDKINPNSNLIIVGAIESQRLFKELNHFIKQNNLSDRIFFEGPQSEVKKYYKNSNIFVLPSLYEGMSNALLEAMSYSSACITTNYDGASDVIENQKDGVIVPLNNVNDLACSMLEIYNNKNKRHSLGVEAKKKIINKFNNSLVIEKWVSLIKDS